jgi:tetratricopeptide (TPR) repeat protein
MRKISWILPITILIWTVYFSSLSHSIEMDPEIKKSYMASDYVTTAKLLEQQVKQIRERTLKGESINLPDLYMKYFFLAQVYMRKLNKPDEALSKYLEANELRKTSKEMNKFPSLEFLYVGEIYERKNNFSKAIAYYQNLLKEFASLWEKEPDTVSIIMAEDLTKFVKYQIDGLNLKTLPIKEYKPLLKKLKLSSQYNQLTPFLAMSLVPTTQYDFSLFEKVDFAHTIKQSPTDLASMIQNYALVLAASASSVNESSERAMEAYLSKYPESYYSLSLRYLFYKFYKENEQIRKAERMARELEGIAKKRGMEIIIGPDKRFSSPEKTWETYRNAMKAGDIDTVMECYVQGIWKEREIFTLLGKEKMKEIGKDLRDIEKISAGDREAEYHILRKQKGEEISYGIYFHNIDGEWKMREF